MDKIIISCDGGARIKPGVAREFIIGGFGVVMVYGEHRKEIHEGHLGVTNNQMEILAVVRGLQMIKKNDIPIEVQSDSAYVVNAINKKWLEGWYRRGWLKSNNDPVENQELWQQLLNELSRFKFVSFVKVKGHSGDPLNERADELANIAMDKLQQERLQESSATEDDREVRRKILFDKAVFLKTQAGDLKGIVQNKIEKDIPKSEIDDFVSDCNKVIDLIEDYKKKVVEYLTGGK